MNSIRSNLICTFLSLILIFTTTLSCQDKGITMQTENIKKNHAIRSPEWAGKFYPYNAKKLKNQIDNYLENAESSKFEGELIGLVVPHAGYIYSGPIAAYSYKNLINKDIETVILIGPAHHAYLKGIAIDNKDYETPLGVVKLDKDTRDEICSKIGGDCFDELPLAKEHSLEVQLPFLQTVLPNASIVPILTNNSVFVENLARAISGLKKQNNKIFFIASSDFSHYLEYEKANNVDKHTIDKILSMDEKSLLKDYNKRQESPCGCVAIATVMLASKLCGADKAILFKYANSGDTAGDRSGVVGYSAIGFYKSTDKGRESVMDKGDILSREQQIKLLKLARKSIETYLKSSQKLVMEADDSELNAPLGAFVTLTIDEQLRGCIGRFGPTDSLWKTVLNMAVEAAVHDPRFPVVTEKELDKIDIEISVLSLLEECKDVNKIEVGVHGLEIEKGWYRGVLLPQVATDYNWDRETFLEHTCLKAGLSKNAWKEGAKIFTFTAQVFNEKQLKLR